MESNVVIKKRKLTFRDAAKRFETPLLQKDYLRLLPDHYVFTPDINYYVEELPHAFEKYSDDSYKKCTPEQLYKTLKYYGDDCKYLNMFTDDFITLGRDVLNEQELNPNVCTEDLDDIISIIEENRFESPRISPSLEKMLQSMFEDEISAPLLQSEESAIEPKRKSTTRRKESLTPEMYESRFWDNIEPSNDFHISYPGYNAFVDNEKHQVHIEPIPWSVVESSHKKCIEWLQKYCDD